MYMYVFQRWEREINAINTDPASVVVENNVDLEGPPSKFTYINKSIATEGLEIPDDPMIGCECENCLDVSEFHFFFFKVLLD